MTISAQQFSIRRGLDSQIIDRLSLALDPDYIANAINSSWPSLSAAGLTVANCGVDRLHPRSDGSFIVSYDVMLCRSGKPLPQTIFGVISASDDPATLHRQTKERLRKLRRRQVHKHKKDHRIGFLPEPGMVMQFAGLDERIDGLKFLRSPVDIISSLPETVQDQFCDNIQTKLFAHRLHRRAVIQFTGQGRSGNSNSIVLKFYKNNSDRVERINSIVRFMRESAFGPTSNITVPKILCTLPEWSALAMAYLPGQPVGELSGDALLRGMVLAGEALGKIHRLPLQLDARFGPRDELHILAKWVDLASAFAPRLSPRLADCMATVSRLLGNCENFIPTLIHRDYHEKQILADDDRGFLVDFDTVCNGDPALDVGNFLAHLRFAEMQQRFDADLCAETFLKYYEQVGGEPDSTHVAAYEAASYLRLACIYSFNTRWRGLSPALLDLI